MAKDWIQTYSGGRIRPLDPDPSDIHLDDVAQALSNKCRFTGHCPFYSVAQHSVLVSQMFNAPPFLSQAFNMPPLVAQMFNMRPYSAWGLMHDAAEAYLWDMATPVKNDPRVAGVFNPIENQLLIAVAVRFQLPWPIPAAVHRADIQLLSDERACLLRPQSWDEWEDELPTPLGLGIVPAAPETAKKLFLAAAERLNVRET